MANTYLKITNQSENHHNLQYQDGLVIDPIPFAKEGSCVPGGIYFTIPEYICKFLSYGHWIREVTIPEDAEIVKDPEDDKWRASKVILLPRKSLGDVSTWEYLVSLGVDITADDNAAVRLASRNGHLEVVIYLVSIGADITACDNAAVRRASMNGHLEVVKYLVSIGADVTAIDNEAVRFASSNGHLEVVKYLVSLGADITADDNAAVRLASRNGHLEVVKYLVSMGADITIKDTPAKK